MKTEKQNVNYKVILVFNRKWGAPKAKRHQEKQSRVYTLPVINPCESAVKSRASSHLHMDEAEIKAVDTSKSNLSPEKKVQNPNDTLPLSLKNQFAMATFRKEEIAFKS